MAAPPEETIQTLLTLISPILTTLRPEQITDTLNAHKAHLLSYIRCEPSTNNPEIVYRPNQQTTETHPSPTTAETQWLAQHNLPLPNYLAALHLRDYLHHNYPTNTHRHLHSTSLVSYAAPHQVFQFALDEISAAYKALTTILTNSQHPHFAQFLAANTSPIRDAIIAAAKAAIAPTVNPRPEFAPPATTSLALLLTATATEFLSLDDVLSLLPAYLSATQSQSAPVHPSLRNDPASLYLLTATLTTAARAYPSQLHASTNAFRALLKHDSPLSVLVSLSVSALLSRLPNNSTDPSVATSDLSREFMTYALSADALGHLTQLLQQPLSEVETEVQKLMYNAFTEDLLSFLSVFPPRSLEPSQIEQLSHLVTGLMSRSDSLCIADMSKSMWENDADSPVAKGLESILNLSAAMYPLSFRPLITLLRELAADNRSAVYVAEYLEMNIMTLCESTEGYSDALIALDEDEDIIWDKLRDYCHHQHSPRILSDVRMGACTVFIQAMREISGGMYRGGLPAGLVGVSEETFSTVVWVHPWNGFNAVVFALDTLHDLLHSEASPSPDFRAVVGDLIESAVEGMRFVEKLCLKGTETLRQHLCERLGITDTVARILAEILALKGKANFPQELLPVLLRSASCCLPALVGQDPLYADRVAGILSCAVDFEKLPATVSSFGETGLTVLSALASISLVMPDETSSPRSIDTMTDFSANDSGSGTLRESMIRLLCSGNLITTVASCAERETSTSWLPVLWSMRVLQDRPDILLSSSSSAKLFESVILNTASRLPLSHSEVLLYPTACEAVTACMNALRYRRKRLLLHSSSSASSRGNTKAKSDEVKLTALEEAMLRPNFVNAMAMLSCGAANRLQNQKFYTDWSLCKEEILLPSGTVEMDHQLSDWRLNDGMQKSQSRGAAWLCDMVTRCLSLQMDCLSHLKVRRSAPQVPWPSSSSTLESDFCVGAVVRQAIAKRIALGHGAELLRFFVAVLFCHQRAALRSLCGPRRPSATQANVLRCNRSESLQGKGEPSSYNLESNGELRDPIRAAIHCLKHCFQAYQSALAGGFKEKGYTGLKCLGQVGQLSMMIASCVKMLRFGLESQNSRWFRDYIDLDFWKLLTSLVQSETGIGDPKEFNLVRATQDWFACKSVTEWSEKMELDFANHVVNNAERILDVGSIWKIIAADVFHITSKEILAEANEVLLATGSDEISGEYRLKESLFERPLFTSFASVFSESWVAALVGREHTRDCINFPERESGSQDSKHLGAVPNVTNLTRRISTRIEDTANISYVGNDILFEFDLSGDPITAYGFSHTYDIAKLVRFLRRKRVDEEKISDLILSVINLNVTILRQEVYVEVLSSFSSMASIILFVDSLCPTPTLALSYASPQFRGKLCRYLPRILASFLPDGALSHYFANIALEISKLLSILSTRLSEEELEKEALTAMDRVDSAQIPVDLRLSTPLGHVCHIINRIVSTENSTRWNFEESGLWYEIISWLLLTGSRYIDGSAFYTTSDLQLLVRCSVRTLKLESGTSEVCIAVATALTAAITSMPDDLFCTCFNHGVLRALLSAIDAVATKMSAADERARGKCTTALLLTLTRAVTKLRNLGNTDTLVSFREINASGVHLLLPSKGQSLETYDFEYDERNVCHTLWCSMLQLAAIAFRPTRDSDDTNMVDSDNRRYAIEFCSINLDRIVDDSLDLQKGDEKASERQSSHSHAQLHSVTLGKVEEAELAATILSRLSSFGIVLQNAMPNTTRRALEQLCRYTAQVVQILQTDPIERWVRPVTRRERERSGVAMEQLTAVVSQSIANMSPSPRRRLRLTPKKSPSQALRAALGGKALQGSTSSPGSSLTPFMSPLPVRVKESRNRPANLSPTSPWGHHGSGLITRTGEYFGEEVSKSLLRGLCAALEGIRELSEQLRIYPFQATMDITGELPGIGTLLLILRFSCMALHREVDDERRACVQGIADTAMNLTLSHAMSHAEAGSLSQSVRDEVRKRVTTSLYRAKNVVPPLPTSSILLDEGLMSLWKRF